MTGQRSGSGHRSSITVFASSAANLISVTRCDGERGEALRRSETGALRVTAMLHPARVAMRPVAPSTAGVVVVSS